VVGYPWKEADMIQLFNKENGKILGKITEQDLQFLKNQLVEESEDDTDYYLNRDELDVLKEKNAGRELIAVLELGFGDKDELEIEWRVI